MPTYRYECASCDAVHEIFQSMSEQPRKKCPDCGGKLERLIGSGGGVILKGSGFYTTEYRSDAYKSAAKKESEAAKPAKDLTGSNNPAISLRRVTTWTSAAVRLSPSWVRGMKGRNSTFDSPRRLTCS